MNMKQLRSEMRVRAEETRPGPWAACLSPSHEQPANILALLKALDSAEAVLQMASGLPFLGDDTSEKRQVTLVRLAARAALAEIGGDK